MFPTPVQQRSAAVQAGYTALLPLALVLWLLPLLMVALFSIKPDTDFTQGNLWGWPSAVCGVRELRPRVHRQRHAALFAEFGASSPCPRSSARWPCPA